MNKIVKPKKYTAALAPDRPYRKDGRPGYRHVSMASNSLEAILAWLKTIEDRKFDKRFPWQSAYIFKRQGYELKTIFSFSFAYK